MGFYKTEKENMKLDRLENGEDLGKDQGWIKYQNLKLWDEKFVKIKK